MIRDSIGDQGTIAQRLGDVGKVQQVLKDAARQAVAEYQQSGQKIVVWRDNQVVWEDPAVGEDVK